MGRPQVVALRTFPAENFVVLLNAGRILGDIDRRGAFYKRINPRLGDGIKLFVVSVAQSRRHQGESGQSGKQGEFCLHQHNNFFDRV
jgi:hypothetical protein